MDVENVQYISRFNRNGYNTNNFIHKKSEDLHVLEEKAFSEKNRHKIDSVDKNTLFDDLKLVVNPGVVNAIHYNLPSLACTQHELVRYFPSTKFWHSNDMVQDIFDKN